MSKPITKLSSSELFCLMSESQKDDIYRMVKADYVTADVLDRCEDDLKVLDENEKESIVEAVVNAIVYDGKENSNISYWDNIDILVKQYVLN